MCNLFGFFKAINPINPDKVHQNIDWEQIYRQTIEGTDRKTLSQDIYS